MSDAAGDTTFQSTKTGLYVPVVTLNTENNKKLSELLRKSLKRSIFLNEYKSKIQAAITEDENANIDKKIILLDCSFQGVNRLFVMAFDNAGLNRVQRSEGEKGHRKYFLPRIEIKDYNILIDGRNFYDQNVSDKI